MAVSKAKFVALGLVSLTLLRWCDTPAARGQDRLLALPSVGQQVAYVGDAVQVGYDCPRCRDLGPTQPETFASPESLPPGAEGATPGPMAPMMPPPAPQASLPSEQFAGLGSQTLTVNDAPGGYLDNPIVGTWFRVRYDNGNNNVRPDRAEFFYAKCGALGGPGPTNANGEIANKVDFQDFSPYFEYQFASSWSAFAEVPVRWVDINFPSDTATNGGLADMNAGLKWEILATRKRYWTMQFKTYAPTGNAAAGLGTRHVSLEPGLLWLRRLGQMSYFQGEVRYWIPIGGTDFAGSVIRYGLGFGYDLLQCGPDHGPLNPYVSTSGLRITSVTEAVGWTVFSGQEAFNDDQGNPVTASAAGDTIVNIKQGVRATVGCRSVYVGWGHALTGDTWYSDLFRLEYRRMF